MNPDKMSTNPPAERARDIARRKNARRATMIGSMAFAIGGVLGWLTGQTRCLPLPNPYEPVHVVGSTGHAHTAYMGEDGKFRSVETGELVPQVVKWSKP